MLACHIFVQSCCKLTSESMVFNVALYSYSRSGYNFSSLYYIYPHYDDSANFSYWYILLLLNTNLLNRGIVCNVGGKLYFSKIQFYSRPAW